MKILYIYRHPDLGYSVGRVFKPIEDEMKKYAEVDSIYLPIPNYSLKGLWKNIQKARTAVKVKQYDIVHITGTENYLIPFLCKHKLVVTVHDIGFFTNEWPSLKALFKYILFVRVLRKATKVTFISETTKDIAQKYVSINPNQILVIANPIGKEFVFTSKSLNKNKPVILHMGTNFNKNLDRTIEAIRGMNCTLRIVGNVSNDQLLTMKKYGIDFSVVQGLTDKQVIEEYQNCDIVNFPSLQEGFGMPIIEGQATGRVVITSNLQPMKGIAGNGAILVDPTDVDSIRNGYKIAMTNYDEIVKLGCENVKRFSLDLITRKYLTVYKNLC